MKNKTVDLNTCVPGQKLRTKHGTILTYIRKSDVNDFYDHIIMYPNGSSGSRTNDGFVYRTPSTRLPEDEDIVEILYPAPLMAETADFVSVGVGSDVYVENQKYKILDIDKRGMGTVNVCGNAGLGHKSYIDISLCYSTKQLALDHKLEDFEVTLQRKVNEVNNDRKILKKLLKLHRALGLTIYK